MSDTSAVSDLERLIITNECQRICALYADAVNRWNLDDFAALFTEDAVWQRPKSQPLVGPAAMKAFLAAQPGPRVLRHINGHVLIDVLSPTRARGISTTTVYDTAGRHELPAPLNGPDMVVQYEDQYVLTPAGWRIARRDTTQLFAVRHG